MHTRIVEHLSQIDITPTTLVLTANQRLALRCQQAHDQRQIDLNYNSWPSPAIYALSHWLRMLAQQHCDQLILSKPQELHIWETIILSNCDDSELLNPADTASTVATAWQSLQLWGLTLDVLDTNNNQEVALFQQWALQFKTLLEHNSWISEAQLATQLLNTPQLVDAHYKQLVLLGFDELPPAIMNLINSLSQNMAVWQVNVEQQPQTIQRIECHDQHAEINLMAQWAQQLHQRQPQAKIGCIIPSLESLRQTLFNTFSERFNPQSLLPGVTSPVKSFNLSAGQRFNEYPIISCALDIINWLRPQLPIDRFADVLQSPYFHQHPQEQDDGARLAFQLCECGEFELPFAAIFAASSHTQLHTELMRRLYTVNSELKSAADYASLWEWKQFFEGLLTTAGWPGYRTLNSEEYQVCMRWRQLLDEFTQYTPVCADQISLMDAIQLLNKLARNTIFQSEGSDAHVQILGVLEASGNNFDYMWVMGLDDESWPAAALPNPFLPYELQHQQHMPHATAERELHYTQQMMQRLSHSAGHILFSSPQFEGDKHKNPSQLITHLELCTDVTMISEATTTTTALEMIDDFSGPALSADETVTGGSSILKQQSSCPFKAFAKVRLKAHAPQPPYFGIAAHQRGTMTHTALEHIWQQLGTQQQLHQLNDTQLNTLIDSSIDQAITDQLQATHSQLNQQLLTLEKKRLQPLLHEWLSYEKKRPAFAVTAIEATQRCSIQSLSFTLRIDRIDTLTTGERIIIDYKTGLTSTAAWFGERPHDPQLPLYLGLCSDINGLAYAELRNNNCRFKAVMCDDTSAKQLPGSTSITKLTKDNYDWAQQLQQWQSTIDHLAYEFTHGIASVTPTQPSTSCAYCDLQPLCRVEMESC